MYASESEGERKGQQVEKTPDVIAQPPTAVIGRKQNKHGGAGALPQITFVYVRALLLSIHHIFISSFIYALHLGGH